KLCQAFGIDRAFDGADLVTGDRGVAIHDDGVAPPAAPVVGRRIGIKVAVEHPWRWHVPDNPHVSRPR
ncbi:DNA-3-methyladenine glycosylase, partial [Citrobacter sp. AAK_AS5]